MLRESTLSGDLFSAHGHQEEETPYCILAASYCYQDQHLPQELGYYKMYLQIPNDAQIDRHELYDIVWLYKSPKIFKYNLQGIQHVGTIQTPH